MSSLASRIKPPRWNASPGLVIADSRALWRSLLFSMSPWGGVLRENLAEKAGKKFQRPTTGGSPVIFGGDVDCPSSGAYVSYADGPHLRPSTALTAMHRFKWNGTTGGSYGGVFFKQYLTGGDSPSWTTQRGSGSTKIYGAVKTTIGRTNTAAFANDIPTDRFVTICLYWQSGGKVYLEAREDSGKLIERTESSGARGGSILYSTNGFHLGKSDGAYYYYGTHSYFHLFDSVLLESERQRLAADMALPFRMADDYAAWAAAAGGPAGTGTLTFSKATIAAQGTHPFTSSGALVLANAIINAVGEQPHEATAAVALANATLVGTASQQMIATATVALQNAIVAASGSQTSDTETGTGALALSSSILVGQGVMQPEATAVVNLANAILAAQGVQQPEATAALFLAATEMQAEGTLPDSNLIRQIGIHLGVRIGL